MIRWKLFLPALAVIVLVLWINLYRLEGWLHRGLESGISVVTGTKTGISELHLSLLNTRLALESLEIASANQEYQNALEFADIVVDFEFLPLLERRLVVEDISIRGLAWGTSRETSGFLASRKQPSKPSWLEQSMGTLRSEFDQMPLSRLADFEVPSDVQEVLALVELESVEAVRDLVVEFQEARAEWSQELREFRSFDAYRDMEQTAERLARDLPSRPEDILERVEELKNIYQFFQRELDRADQVVDKLRDRREVLQSRMEETRALIEADFQRARARVSLDELNIENLSQLLFGRHWLERIETLLWAQNRLEQFFQVAKNFRSDDDEVEVRSRARGRDIRFVDPKQEPGFLLKHSELSVTGLEREAEGRLSQVYEMDLSHLNTAPKIHTEPMEIELSARFREAVLSQLELLLLWDYRAGNSKSYYEAKVEDLNASQWPVGIPQIFPVQMASGQLHWSSEFEKEAKEIHWNNHVRFSEINWDFSKVSNIGFIVPSLVSSLEEVSRFDLEFKVSRENQGLRFQVSSDLDQQLKQGIEQRIQEEWRVFEARLRAEVERKGERYRSEAQSQLSRFQDEIYEPILERKEFAEAQLESVEKKRERLKKEAKKRARGKVEDQTRERLDELGKELPNPF